jgi:hypothetical protein
MPADQRYKFFFVLIAQPNFKSFQIQVAILRSTDVTLDIRGIRSKPDSVYTKVHQQPVSGPKLRAEYKRQATNITVCNSLKPKKHQTCEPEQIFVLNQTQDDILTRLTGLLEIQQNFS